MDNRHFGGPRPLPGCRPSFGDLEFSAAEINELLKRLVKMQDVEGLVSGVNIVNIENHELLQPGNLTLEDLGAARLANMNDVFVPWQGSAYATRNYLPALLRRKGISISYVTDKGIAVKERAVSDVGIDNANWGIDSNWMRVDELSLNGELRVSPNGTWVINGVDTGIQALGPKGDNGLTPRLKTIDNKLHYSYDGKEWLDAGGEHIAAWFRWSGNKIQISRDNKTWEDFSGEFADNLFIKGYVATFDKLPADAVQGDIWGVGPRYAAEDTEQTQPIYRYWVRNAGGWVDNGEFTSIAAGIVQETGDGEGVVMSQKAVSGKLAELESYNGYCEIIPDCLYSRNGNIGGILNNAEWDIAIIKVFKDEGEIQVEGATPYNYVFFNSSNVTDTYLTASDSGVIPTNAKLCVINFKKESNLEGYDNIRVRQDYGAADKADIDKAVDIIEMEIFKKCVFLYNSVVSTSTNNLVDSTGFDSVLISIPKGTHQINISGVTYSYINIFSEYDFTSENFLGREVSGNINKLDYSNAKFAIISLSKSSNPDGIKGIEIDFLTEEAPILLGKTCSIIYNKVCSISGGVFSYANRNDYDLLVIQLKDKVNKIQIDGVEVGAPFCFSSLTPSDDSYIGYNEILPEAKCVVYNINKNTNEGADYSKIYVKQCLDTLEQTRFDTLFGEYLEIVPTSKNYINANDLLVGYIISGGKLIARAGGVMSNKIYLENGKTYTMQGIYYYGASNRIFIGYFNAKDEFIGRGYVDAIFEEGNKYGNGTFTFNDNNGIIKYIRIVLGDEDYPFDASIAQLEEGTEATEVVPFEGYETLDFNVGNSGSGTGDNTSSNHIKLLCVGNSYSQDALAYVPYIMKTICPDIPISIGILYLSGARLNQHYDNFINNNSSYYYYKYNDGDLSWQTVSTAYTIQEALADDKWNMVLLHQGSIASFDWSTYQPYLNRLIDLIYGDISYPVKFGWMLTQSRPKASDNAYSDEEILEHYASIAENSKRVMDETLCEFIIPVGTAVENARTTSLNELGDYELGKLCSSDGGHLQEGLPSQLAAYVCVLKLLELIGKSYNSIYGDTNRITSDWVMGKNIPGANGEPIGSDDYNCAIAQKCAIMAVKHPYKITQMVNLGIVDEVM